MTAVSRRAALLGLAAGLALPLVACANPSSGARVRMACGEPGGLYLQFGELLRDVLERRGIALDVLASNGSADNLALLRRGDADLALALADSAEQQGAGLTAIGQVYQNYLQCVVRADGGARRITDLADLAGRRVSIGAPGSGSSLTTRRVLRAAGLLDGPEPPELGQHPLEDALRALETGRIDAFFWSGGIPTPKIAELGARTPLALVDLAPALARLSSGDPDQYLPARVPAGVYGIPVPTSTIGIPNLLLARPELADATAQGVVDALIDDAPSLVPAGSVGVQFLTGASLIDTGTLPLHPAAKRRYRERAG
ncbi:hypothetical protein BMH32_03890 [Leucobacter sp. OLJS4]|uniref:TAXI family TRAP transporter solute-binding subunit n=1 Tax=unclassified Leucobacter TaxID=2621730 RepID=UPI000C189368|nr:MULTISPECIES: TAXI family TRAP transporter solute-binding subunit [unclassified Leucobacter]PII82830.1 hypothetical protein BMH25_08815 [Leucobacter sp. OLCALW19]PII88062.1 hypothetical protein BMH26_07285 [Leucobacter sp. OLTLW20]PII91920.1 hypothetical protein BMH27_07370 [Leucobacter sp. OLAS13]PIJ00242.1 hypothetical protein BMH29_02655 [Leucobacter sp. OLDS2]PIJ02835.1 hypothetical protein BMH28_04200 [Leucobacter sp. OLCS4]